MGAYNVSKTYLLEVEEYFEITVTGGVKQQLPPAGDSRISTAVAWPSVFMN